MSKLNSVKLKIRLGFSECEPVGSERLASAALKELDRLSSIATYFESGCACSRNYRSEEDEQSN